MAEKKVTKKKTTKTEETKTKSESKKSEKKGDDKLVFQRHEKDTGSPEVQVSLLSEEIKQLQGHLESHKKDYDAKRCLLKKVAKRRTFLKYLKGVNLERYTAISKKLDIKV